MAWHTPVWTWLAHAAWSGFLLLSVGCLAVLLCRRPARRLRLIELTLVGCLLAPWMSLMPVLPHWSAGWLGARESELEPAPVNASQDVPLLQVTRETPQPAPGVVAPPASEPVQAIAAGKPTVAPQVPAASFRLSLPQGLVLAYAGGVIGLAFWWVLGAARLAFLRRLASPIAGPVREIFQQIAGPAGKRVRLLASDRLGLPLTFGWLRPVILLPDPVCAGEDRAALRYCLAHEWSHVERRDVLSWYVATLAQLVLFYHPLFWWLRRQMRLCQDFLADARAAEEASEAADYAEYLVSLARGRPAFAAPAALGIADRRSNIYRRVLMLVQTREPLERSCPGGWNVTCCLAAAALVAALSAVRLDAGDTPKPTPPATAKETKPAAAGQTFKYSGRVVEKGTGKPIEGATVTVRRSLYGDPTVKGSDIVEETKHQTDKTGTYHFTIPQEQAAQRYLYIELDVAHPNYAPRDHFGYSFAMIQKNEKMGGRPFFEHVELQPGEPITGRIETPDGKPAASVKILAYSKGNVSDFREYGSFARAQSDDQGIFRVTVIKGGEAVFWILPEHYAPSRHIVKKKRGDLGVFGLEKGVALRGRVLDAHGKPLAGLWVNARRERARNEQQDEILQRVADAINRSALSDAQGNFELAPLPAGVYDIKPDEHSHDSSREDRRRISLPAVFAGQKVTLKDGEQPEPLEVRAVPHVTIEARYLDSKGKPSRGHECFIFGRMDGGFWNGTGRPDADGKIVALAPHGLQGAQLDLMTNEHGCLRWRKGKGDSLHNSRQLMLGTLEGDQRGIEIIRYVAPILIVKVRDKSGAKPKGAAVTATYPEGKAQYSGKMILKDGLNSDVSFEEQEDGRFRSEQLFPDEEVTVTAQAEGFAPRSEKIKLAEGTTRDLEIVLEKK